MHIHFTILGPKNLLSGRREPTCNQWCLCACVCVCASFEHNSLLPPKSLTYLRRTLGLENLEHSLFNQRVLQASQSLSRTCGEGRPENSARIVFPGKRADSGNGECCTESATHRFAPAFALFTLGSLPSLPNHPLWYFKNH